MKSHGDGAQVVPALLGGLTIGVDEGESILLGKLVEVTCFSSCHDHKSSLLASPPHMN